MTNKFLYFFFFFGIPVFSQVLWDQLSRIPPPPPPPFSIKNSNEFKKYKNELNAWHWSENKIATVRDCLLAGENKNLQKSLLNKKIEWAIRIEKSPAFDPEKFLLILKSRTGELTIKYVFINNKKLHEQLISEKLQNLKLINPNINSIMCQTGCINNNEWPNLNDFVKKFENIKIGIFDNFGMPIDGEIVEISLFSSRHSSIVFRGSAVRPTSELISLVQVLFSELEKRLSNAK